MILIEYLKVMKYLKLYHDLITNNRDIIYYDNFVKINELLDNKIFY